MFSRFSRSAFAALLVVPAFVGCNCDDVLSSRIAEAELAHVDGAGADDQVTPPLATLDVALGAVEVGGQAAAHFELRSTGNLPLAVSSVALGADPVLCPSPSAAFHLDDVLLPPERSLAPGTSVGVDVRFTPSDGAPGCVVLQAATADASHPVLTAVLHGQGDAAALCADRGVIDFGDVLVGTTKDDTAVLTSCGTRPVTIVAVTPDAIAFPPFGVDAVPSITLAPGESAPVPVHFTPTAPQRYSVESGTAGVLTVSTDLVGQLFQIVLVGVGKTPPACVLDVVPATLSFGFVQAGTTTTQPVLVRNIGDLPCTIDSLALRDNEPAFSFSAPLFSAGMTLDPFAVLDVTVTFNAPASEATVNDALVITSDDPVAPTVEVPIQGAVPPDEGCFVNVTPTFVDFGAVAVNTLRAREVVVTNISSDPCFIDDTRIGAGSDPGFIDTSSDFGMIQAGSSKTLTVGFRPTTNGAADGTFEIDVTDQPLFGGTTTTTTVALSGFTADPGICVTPRHLDFGETASPAEQTFLVSACGAATIRVDAFDFTQVDPELTLVSLPSLPLTLAAGDGVDIRVRYAPTDNGGDTAVVTVRSSDLVAPAIDVTLTGGHTIVPPEAGRFLYYWQIPSPVGGDVMKVPLQGDTTPSSFWGPRSGKQCAGCHSISPDGKYVAVIEVGFTRFVEADSNLELTLDGTQFLDPTSFSWRPRIDTTPPYQFAYSDGADIRIGSLFDGEIGVLHGADDATLVDTMPSWGKDGTIAFVRGQQATTDDNGTFGLQGTTDILLVPDTGGVAVPVVGASQNGMANYYPAFSPNGLWIAFTQSPSASSTIAATDARIRMAKGANDGAIFTLDNLNDASGASSYTTWSVNGAFLSFSSQRAGGAGDWDIWLAPMDPFTGADGAATNLTEVNSAAFEHAAQWSP